MNISSLATSLARRCRITSTAPSTTIGAAGRATGSGSKPNQNFHQIKLSQSNSSGNDVLVHGRSLTSLAQSNKMMRPNPSSPSSSSWTGSTAATVSWKRDTHSLLTNKSILQESTSKTTTALIKATLIQRRTMATQKHKRIIKMAKGFRGRSKNTFRAAIRRVEKGLQYAYRDRKMKKRNFRKLWIEKVNAGVRQHGMSYSRFINAMNNLGGDGDGQDGSEKGAKGQKKIILNRKVLADLAANEPFSFKAVVDVVKMSTAK
eukprot:CAMPEP_0203636408 /NCGR_PEP_ID=MMETSP0088-20131115/2955_1 /ASSEMBLY_ACC=CAM_ASM_001087 /TAXON_ID=426623 /ORGANISM="Chaetoceros affinis, Strain CCMP159" /LENGTH=260 /DNA_ID=CAMNT_0050490527 /DNA_START=37 /DNA_END=819 /DNA_ORIENTATION=+